GCGGQFGGGRPSQGGGPAQPPPPRHSPKGDGQVHDRTSRGIGGVIRGCPHPLPRLHRVLPRRGGGELVLSLVRAAMAAWLLTACGAASAPPPDAGAMAAGYSVKKLAGGQRPSLLPRPPFLPGTPLPHA